MKSYFYGQTQAKKLIDVLNNIIFLLTGKQEGGHKQSGDSSSYTKNQNINLLDMVYYSFYSRAQMSM